MHPEAKPSIDPMGEAQECFRYLRDQVKDKPHFYPSELIGIASDMLTAQLNSLTDLGERVGDAKTFAFETSALSGANDKEAGIAPYRGVIYYWEDGELVGNWQTPLRWRADFWQVGDIRPRQLVADVYGRMGMMRGYFEGEEPYIDMKFMPGVIFGWVVEHFGKASDFPLQQIPVPEPAAQPYAC